MKIRVTLSDLAPHDALPASMTPHLGIVVGQASNSWPLVAWDDEETRLARPIMPDWLELLTEH